MRRHPAPAAVGRRRGCGTSAEHAMWLVRDPCGLMTVVLAYTMLWFGVLCVGMCVLAPWMGGTAGGALHSFALYALAGLTNVCHLRAMLTDPGAVPPGAQQPLDTPGVAQRGVCKQCQSFKPRRAHHCSTCGRCIVKMDHHCPWINNCVGLTNHKFFLLFLLYGTLLAGYGLVLILWRFLGCDASPCFGTAPGAGTMVSFTVGIAVLLGMFTCCMLSEQIRAVMDNVTAIDRLKGIHDIDGAGSSVLETLTWVFGGKPEFSFSWLIPTAVHFVDVEQVAGYSMVPQAEVEEERDDLEMV